MVSQVSFCCARALFEYCLLISPPSIQKEVTKNGGNMPQFGATLYHLFNLKYLELYNYSAFFSLADGIKGQ